MIVLFSRDVCMGDGGDEGRGTRDGKGDDCADGDAVAAAVQCPVCSIQFTVINTVDTVNNVNTSNTVCIVRYCNCMYCYYTIHYTILYDTILYYIIYTRQ